jgi:hypothetical protein
MKANFLVALLFTICVCGLTIARAEDSVKLTGQVFIRTNGGDSIKLSLVEVDLFDEKVIDDDLAGKRKASGPLFDTLSPLAKKLSDEADAAQKTADAASSAATAAIGTDGFDAASQEEMKTGAVANKASAARDKVLGALCYLESTFYLFSNLPKPLQVTKTDADGKFAFDVPRGSYVLVASSSRNAGAEVIGDSAIPKTEYYDWMVRVNLDSNKDVMLANDNLSSSGSRDSVVKTDENEELAVSAVGDGGIQSVTDLATQLQESERQEQLAEFSRDPQLAQQKAVELYPDLGVAGSDLNKEFIARMKRYQVDKTYFFADADWPIRLAKECSEDLTAKHSVVSGTSTPLPSP